MDNKFEEKIIFKCKCGSILYGTNSINSDLDIKGVFIPKLEDLILERAPKHYTFSTGKYNSRNTKDDVDQTYYSLQYFLELASKGDTNAIDMLFAYTNKDAVIYKDPIWDIIINNIDKIICRNTKAFIGYCKGQCVKYSIKGDKLNNFKNFKNILEWNVGIKDQFGAHVSLLKVLENHFGIHVISIPQPGAECIKLNTDSINNILGNHVYTNTADNKESYITISDVKFCLNESVVTALHKINKVIQSYGKRAENAAQANGADYKAISHCIRVLLEVEQLLTERKITFPLKEAEFIKSIKYNNVNLTFDQIMSWINDKISYIDDVITPNSCLPEKSNYSWINEFILSCYLNKY